MTVMVTKPEKLDGRAAVMEVLLQEAIGQVVVVVEPPGWPGPRNREHGLQPKALPVMVMLPPEVTILASPP